MQQLAFNSEIARLRDQLCREFINTGEINPIIMSELRAFIARRANGLDIPALPTPTSLVGRPRKAARQALLDDVLPRIIAGQAFDARQDVPFCDIPPGRKRKPKRRLGHSNYEPCSIPGCKNTINRRGLCAKHLTLAMDRGELPRLAYGTRKPTTPDCSMPGCSKGVYHRGLCKEHYCSGLADGSLPFLRAPKKIILGREKAILAWLENKLSTKALKKI